MAESVVAVVSVPAARAEAFNLHGALCCIQEALKAGDAGREVRLDIEAYVRHSRVAARIAFVDLMDETGQNVLQAVFSQGTFRGSTNIVGARAAEDSSMSEMRSDADGRSLAAYTALCKPGAKVRLCGLPDAGAFGEPMLKVIDASLLLGAPCCHAAARLLHEVNRGVVAEEEAASAMSLAGGVDALRVLIGQCRNALGAHYAELRHAAPDVVRALEGSVHTLRRALPSVVGDKIFREKPELPDSSWLPACANAAISAVKEALPARLEADCGYKLCLRSVDGWVQARRRFAGGITVLTLTNSDGEQSQGCEMLSDVTTGQLHVVLHPSIFDGGSYDTDDRCTRLHMYGDLSSPGSCMHVTGMMAADVLQGNLVDVPGCWMYATNVALLSCCPQLKTLRCAVDFATKGLLPLKEAAQALALDAASATALLSLDDTGRAWAAADAVQRLQSRAGGNAQVGLQRKLNNKDGSEILVALSAHAMVRERWPAQEEPDLEQRTTDAEAPPDEQETSHGYVANSPAAQLQSDDPKCAENLAVDCSASPASVQPPPAPIQRTLPLGRAGSRWTNRKRPQIDWVSSVVEGLVERHPSASSRPLHVLDVGGGQGLLASHVAERLGPRRVEVTVLEIGELHASRGERRVSKQQLENVRFRVGDASSASLDEPEQKPDVVMALHACGVLSDVALGIAARHGASFCICQCCFKSNPTLRIGEFSPVEWLRTAPADLEQALEAAASNRDSATAALGMHTVSAWRADAVKRHWAPSVVSSEGSPEVDIRISRFPIRWSPCNFCLIGEQRCMDLDK